MDSSYFCSKVLPLDILPILQNNSPSSILYPSFDPSPFRYWESRLMPTEKGTVFQYLSTFSLPFSILTSRGEPRTQLAVFLKKREKKKKKEYLYILEIHEANFPAKKFKRQRAALRCYFVANRWIRECKLDQSTLEKHIFLEIIQFCWNRSVFVLLQY